MHRILIIEDESCIASFIEKGLKANGFAVTIATNGDEAILQTLDSVFDLLILDLDLPGKNGLEVIEELRGQGKTAPIIILTARNDIQSKISGFDRGADDYMTKPFRFEELLVRIKARLRQFMSTPIFDSQVLQVANVQLNLHTRKVRLGEREIGLSAREFILAEVFFRHPGQVLTREHLLNHIWGYNHNLGSNIVDVYVGYLRKKLGRELIETVRGMGYRLSKMSMSMSGRSQ